jgi:hypothetical protein
MVEVEVEVEGMNMIEKHDHPTNTGWERRV